jgi:hypothetical protein
MKNQIDSTQMPLFASPREMGRSEWKIFNTIAGDYVGMFRVATPRKHSTPRYPNIVHINRYPRHLTPRFGH